MRPPSASRAWRIARATIAHGPRSLALARRAIARHGAVQRTWELMSLVGLVAALRPRTVVEIGTHNGGTLICWAAVADPRALLISVDFPNGQLPGRPDDGARRFQRFLRAGQSLSCLCRDSHDPATLASVKALLDGRPVDFLFIDGDHSLAGVAADHAMYAPLVRSGGLIAFHDIRPSALVPDAEAHVFWRGLRTAPGAVELVDQAAGEQGMGIGVIRV
jgi:cephalosporin hydroxylase